MIFQLFEQIIAKIISAAATLILALGIIGATPAVEYTAPFHKTVQNTTDEITATATPQKITESEVKRKIPSVSLPVVKKGKEPESPSAENPVTPSVKQKEPEPPALSQTPAISLTELNEKTRKTIVNIFCGNQGGASVQGITGSGVIISPKGVILTNSHIGQYFLLENSPASGYLNCQIRNGNIAEPAYDAKLIYIPSTWVEQNIDNIVIQEAKGTGQDDYAFLLIDKSIVAGKEIPQNFDFTEPNFEFSMLPFNFSTLVASYPAGLLGADAVLKNLGLISTFAPITDLFTFGEKGLSLFDIFAIGGNIASQGGSSGGAVVSTVDGKLLGIITTSSEATTTAKRTLYAITLPYIKRSFETYTGKNIAWFLEDPTAYDLLPAGEFNRLKELLLKRLEKK